MVVEYHVKLGNTVMGITDILSSIRNVMTNQMSITSTLELAIQRGEWRSNDLVTGSCDVLGPEDTVIRCIFTYMSADKYPEWNDDSDNGYSVSVDFSGARTANGFLLATAVAMGLAKCHGTRVTDEMNLLKRGQVEIDPNQWEFPGYGGTFVEAAWELAQAFDPRLLEYG